jgi:hypothetical protein
VLWQSSRRKLTHSGNDLCLETKLVLETAGEVGETALAVSASVGHFADVVEHVPACEEKDGDQADGSPKVAVLDDGKKVGRGDCQEGEDTDDGSRDGDDLHIVDRTLDRRVRGVGKVTAQPRVDRLSLVRTDAFDMLVANERDNIRMNTHPERKSKRVGEGSVFALGPVVGWKRSRMGAVCSCSYNVSATVTILLTSMLTHRLKSRLAIQKVQCSEQQSSCSCLVALAPAAR